MTPTLKESNPQTETSLLSDLKKDPDSVNDTWYIEGSGKGRVGKTEHTEETCK